MPTTQRPEHRLLTSDRFLLAGTGVALLVLLITASCLQPDNAGMGTHRQLGLPACSFLQLTGKRCPGCGMTTAWSYYTRGDLISAARVNAGGLLLGFVATAAIPWLIVSGWRGRWLFGPLRTEVTIVVVAVLASVIVATWLWRIFG